MTFHACHKSDWRGPWQFKYVEVVEFFRPSGAWVLEWGLQGEVQRAWGAGPRPFHDVKVDHGRFHARMA